MLTDQNILLTNNNTNSFLNWKQSVIANEQTKTQICDTTTHADLNQLVNVPSSHDDNHSDHYHSHDNTGHDDDYHLDTPYAQYHYETEFHYNNSCPEHNDTRRTPKYHQNDVGRENTPKSAHKNESGYVSWTSPDKDGVDEMRHQNNHTDDNSYHNDNGEHDDYNPHKDTTEHTDTGFDHENYIPSAPKFFNIEDSLTDIRGVTNINLLSYDKNNDGVGSQDSVSKVIKYKLEIRQTKKLDGTPYTSNWSVLQDFSTNESYTLNTIDPLKIGNVNYHETEGYYELRATPRNDSISIKGITKNYIGIPKTVAVKIQQNYTPQTTVTNGNEFVSFVFGNDYFMDKSETVKTYSDTLYAEAPPEDNNGLFVSINMSDRDPNDYQKAIVYIQKPDRTKLTNTSTKVIWENGKEIVQSGGNTVKGYAFISKSALLSAGSLKDAKVIVETTDYVDAYATYPAGYAVTQYTINSNGSGDAMLVSMDVDKPSVTFTPNGGVFKPSYSTVLSVADNLIGVKDIYYQWTDSNKNPDDAKWIAIDNNITLNAPNVSGTYILNVKTSDRLNNILITKSNVYNVDTVNPEVLISNNTNWSKNATVPVILSATDNISGINRIEYRLSGVTQTGWTTYDSTKGLNISNEGITNIEARTYDNAGNVSTIKTSIVKIDLSLPIVNISKDNLEVTNKPVKISIRADDILSGVDKIILPNGNQVVGSSADFSVSENGTYKFTVVDRAGNAVDRTSTVDNIDIIPPVVTLTPSTTEITKNPVIVTVKASDNLSGVATIKLPDGTVVTNQTTTTFVADKNDSYDVEVTDRAGNKTIQTIPISNIAGDLTSDDYSISYTLSPSTWTNQNVTISLSVMNTNGISNITNPDGTVQEFSDSINANLNFDATSNKDYTFVITDRLGNVITKTITISNIDKDHPILDLSYPMDWTNQSTNITAIAEDSQSGVDYIILPDGNKVSGSNANFTVTNSGQYAFKVADKAGNAYIYYLKVINIDKNKPNIQIINETDWNNKQSISVEIKADDTIK